MFSKKGSSSFTKLKSSNTISSDTVGDLSTTPVSKITEELDTAVVNRVEVKPKIKSNGGKSKLDQVEDFFNRYQPPVFREVSVEKTQGFVEEILEPRLRYNLLTQDVELDEKSLRRHQNETLDVVNRMLVVCEKEYQVKFKSIKQFRNHLMNCLSRNPYHPVEEYLNSLDSTTPVSIDNLAEQYLGNKNPLANTLLKKTLIAAVARVLNPGCKADSILILYSAKQGIGKSSFLRTLAKQPEWFNDTVPKLNLTKDFYSKLHQNWFTEIGEIDTKFSRIKQEEIKDFITSSTDQFRPAYTATMLNCQRRFVLTGSTNNANFLDDPTGSRRYWIVKVKQKIDISHLEKEVDGIWAAAVKAYNNGEQWHLSEQEEKMLEQSNASYTYEHPWYQIIKLYLNCHKLDLYVLPKSIAAIPALDIPRCEINKPNSKALKDIRNLLQHNFGYYRKKISDQQRQKLFDELNNDRKCQPQVMNVSEIPYSIWVKSDDFCVEDLNQRQLHESKAA